VQLLDICNKLGWDIENVSFIKQIQNYHTNSIRNIKNFTLLSWPSPKQETTIHRNYNSFTNLKHFTINYRQVYLFLTRYFVHFASDKAGTLNICRQPSTHSFIPDNPPDTQLSSVCQLTVN